MEPYEQKCFNPGVPVRPSGLSAGDGPLHIRICDSLELQTAKLQGGEPGECDLKSQLPTMLQLGDRITLNSLHLNACTIFFHERKRKVLVSPCLIFSLSSPRDAAVLPCHPLGIFQLRVLLCAPYSLRCHGGPVGWEQPRASSRLLLTPRHGWSSEWHPGLLATQLLLAGQGRSPRCENYSGGFIAFFK